MARLRQPPTEKSRFRGWILPIGAGLLCGTLVAVVIALSYQREPDDESEDPPPGDPPAGMVWVRGGTFTMGNNRGAEDERPAHVVRVSGFWMDRTEVTNAQFAEFVAATKYITIAERPPDPKKYPEARPENLVPGSALFVKVDAPLRGWEQESPFPPWWKYQPGASWRHPEGPGSSIEGKMNYPVVHIAWDDAEAYCKWAGKRLPTEAEWECAARGGLKSQEYCWGSQPQGAEGKWFANTFQGTFPGKDSGADGYTGLAPVGQYPANGFGLHDMSGNVWEWCQDFYDSEYYANSSRDNPTGPTTGEAEGDQLLRVRRGGSFLCDDSYCRRYVPNARDKNPADSGASHTGFRCVREKQSPNSGPG